MNESKDPKPTPPVRRSVFSVPSALKYPAFRYPAYRAFWLASLASVSGYQMLTFGQLWLVHELTESPLFLGYVGVATAVPAIALNLFGGVFADRMDKRRLIVVTQTITSSLIFVLATLTLLGIVQAWHVLVIAFFAGAVNAFDQPARQSLYPHLIDREVMMSAVALNASIWQGTRIAAPAAAGVVIALAGTETAFFLAGAGFLTMAVVMYSLRIAPIERSGSGSAAHDMLEGLKYIKGNSIFSFLIGMTFFNSFFGMAYIMMMPVFAKEILGVGADGQGVLMSAGGVGALITTLMLGSIGNFRRRGLLLIGGAVMFGLSVGAFALTSEYVGSYVLALALMVVMGVFSSAYMISIMSSLQMMVPDRMRGRVMGFYGMTWSIMPLGGMQAGAIGSALGVPVAIAIGGLAVSAFALGPALVNRSIRNLGSLLIRAEQSLATEGPSYQTSTSGDD